MYATGDGVRQDYAKARKYYEKAAAQNDASALYNLGIMYRNGYSVKQDYKKARVWYAKGAENGDAYSMMNLARMTENGLGMKKDVNKAVELYRQAAANSNVQAQKALKRLKVQQGTYSAKTPKQDSVPARNNIEARFAERLMNRPRVAILPFEDRSEEGNAPASAIINMMVTELHKAGIFMLLERERLDDIAKEQKLSQSGLVDPSTALKLGKIAGAQYIITGAVTLCYYSEKASGFMLPILGSSAKAKTAYVVLDIRIIDVETSEIVYSSNQTGDATNKERKNIGSSSKVIGGLLGMATRNAVEKQVSEMRTLKLEI